MGPSAYFYGNLYHVILQGVSGPPFPHLEMHLPYHGIANKFVAKKMVN